MVSGVVHSDAAAGGNALALPCLVSVVGSLELDAPLPRCGVDASLSVPKIVSLKERTGSEHFIICKSTHSKFLEFLISHQTRKFRQLLCSFLAARQTRIHKLKINNRKKSEKFTK